MTTAINSKHRLIIFIAVLIAIGAGIGGYAHQQNKTFKSYVVGLTTPGTKAWVSAAYLDNKTAILGGALRGEWKQTYKTNVFFHKPMPREIYVNWKDEKSHNRYEASVRLATDLTERAKKLPKAHLIVANSDIDTPVIIIGLANTGKVTVWLSNVEHGHNISGRVLEVIGRATGHVTTKTPPLYPQQP